MGGRFPSADLRTGGNPGAILTHKPETQLIAIPADELAFIHGLRWHVQLASAEREMG